MKRRLFIAINLPDSIKNKIAAELEKIRYDFTDEVRFLGRENWHITVTFLDYQSNEAMDAITSAMHLIAAGQQELEINFENIPYGPHGGPPRMLWLNGTRPASD